tara:strand:- start:1137 stop:1319 length:183 start_codon:yes stop_codon:yes gene_type:complete
MTKKIKRIIVTRTIIYDRQMFEQVNGINDDEQFTNYVEDIVDNDFKYPVNFTTDYSFQHD